jgi:hypothetical protein
MGKLEVAIVRCSHGAMPYGWHPRMGAIAVMGAATPVPHRTVGKKADSEQDHWSNSCQIIVGRAIAIEATSNRGAALLKYRNEFPETCIFSWNYVL